MGSCTTGYAIAAANTALWRVIEYLHKLRAERPTDDEITRLRRALSLNAYAVQTNRAIATALQCNTNVVPLATAQDAKIALFYLIGYVTKGGTPLGNSLALLANAQHRLSLYGSVPRCRRG